MSDQRWRVRFRKNESWRESVSLAFSRTLLYAPSCLAWLLSDTMAMLFLGLKMVVMASITAPFIVVFWLFHTLFLIAAGVAGYLIKPSHVKEI